MSRRTGRTEVVSRYRGHPAAHAAKCLVVMVKTGKRAKWYFLAVIPGDAGVDLPGLRSQSLNTRHYADYLRRVGAPVRPIITSGT